MTPRLTHPTLGSEASGLLSGVRVLDLSRLLPGPLCSLHLADLGADVVKVEDTIEGDYARSLGRAGGANGNEPSAFYRMVNRNKRSVALDLKQAAGRDAFTRLAVDADVVIEGFRPAQEVLLEAGLTEAEIAALTVSGSADPESGISVA